MVISSITGTWGKMTNSALLTGASSPRPLAHIKLLLPELLKIFDCVYVMADKVAEQTLRKEKLWAGEELPEIPWPDVTIMFNSADPDWYLQLWLEATAHCKGISSYRYEDMPGCVVRPHILYPKRHFPPLASRYMVINHASADMADNSGIRSNRIQVVGSIDLTLPTLDEKESAKKIRQAWKSNLGLTRPLIVYSTGSSFEADYDNLNAIRAVASETGAQVIVSVHPKLLQAKSLPYDPELAPLARECDQFLKFFQEQDFVVFSENPSSDQSFFYWLAGGRQLIELGCKGSLEGLPVDFVPGDVALFGFQNAAMMNSLLGTPSLNLCTPLIQERCLGLTGILLPMAVASGILPLLQGSEEIISAVSAAIRGSFTCLTEEDVKQVIPYIGQDAIQRIVDYLI